MNTPPGTSSILDSRAKRNLFLLACCQAFGQASNTMMFSATALSVITFYARHDLATLPITLRHVGVMLSVFPASLLMQRVGRKLGFQFGSLTGMLGGLVVSYGLYDRSFILMCVGGIMLGYSVACLQMYRFAAVELAPSSYRAKAISWVTAGGVAAGILGPGLVRWSYDKWEIPYLATYAAMIGLHIVVFTIMSFIRFPPPEAVRQPDDKPGVPPVPVAPPRPLLQIAMQPRFIAAVVAAMVSYGTMSFLMSASPLAIVGCGLDDKVAHTVILLHVMGMFVPSFFTGNLITRFGTEQVMFWGVAILMAGVAVGLAGLTEWHFRIALMLNGVGWNFLFVGATTLVTTCYQPNERGKVQALNDFLVFGTTSSASFLAGFLVEHLGWSPLNWFSLVLISISLLAVISLWLTRRREQAQPA